jgi:hypothetical protein
MAMATTAMSLPQTKSKLRRLLLRLRLQTTG